MSLSEAEARARKRKQGGAPPAPSEPVPKKDIGLDLVKSVPRLAKEIVNFPQTLMQGSTALDDWLTSKQKPTPEDLPYEPYTRKKNLLSKAIDWLGNEERFRPGDLMPEEATSREVEPGKLPWLDRTLLGIEVGANAPRAAVKYGIKKAVPEVTAALGAVAGSEVGKQFDNPYAEAAGTLLGGIGGGMVRPKSQAARIGGVIDDFSLEGISPLASSLRNRADPDMPGTVGDVSGDIGILALENRIAGDDPQGFLQTVQGAQSARDARTVGQVEDIIAPVDVDVKQAQTQAGDEVTALSEELRRTERGAKGEAQVAYTGGKEEQLAAKLASQRRVSKIDQQRVDAQVASESTAEAARVAEVDATSLASMPSVASTQASELVKIKRGSAKEKAKKFWEKFDASEGYDKKELITELQEHLTENLGSMNDPMTRDFAKRFSTYIGHLKALPAEVSPKQIHYLVSNMKKQIHNAHMNNSADVVTTKMSELNTKLDDLLESGSLDYKTAKAFEKEMHDKFGNLGVDSADPEDFFVPGSFSGQKGAKMARWLQETKDPEIVKAGQDYVLSLAKEEGVTAAFRKKYNEYLQHETNAGLNAQISQVEMAQNSAVQMKKNAKLVTAQSKAVGSAEKATQTEVKSTVGRLKQARKKAFDEAKGERKTGQSGLDKSIAARYAEDPPKTIKAMLKSTGVTDAADFKRLNKAMGDGEAGDSFRSQVRDTVLAQITKPVGSVKTPSIASIAQWDKVKKQLVEADVISGAEAAQVTAALKATESKALRKSVRQATSQQIDSAVRDIMTSVGAVGGAKLIKGGSLVMTGAIKRTLNKLTKEDYIKPKDLPYIKKILSDPDFIGPLAKAYKSEIELSDQIGAKLLSLIAAEKALPKEENE